MGLNEKSELIQFPAVHYVFVEKVGPFQQTAPEAWKTLHQSMAEIIKTSKVTKIMSLYKIEPTMIYRAGVGLEAPPENLPEGFQYEHFLGGVYTRFVLTGSYSQLPEACGRVFQIFGQSKAPKREDYYIEDYINDPKTTPENQLITEILIPTKG